MYENQLVIFEENSKREGTGDTCGITNDEECFGFCKTVVQ